MRGTRLRTPTPTSKLYPSRPFKSRLSSRLAAAPRKPGMRFSRTWTKIAVALLIFVPNVAPKTCVAFGKDSLAVSHY
jgi:hypothetical protein